jgi:hypothetical protein
VKHYFSVSFYGIEAWTVIAKYKSTVKAADMKSMRRLDHMIQERNGIAMTNQSFKLLPIF